jgi:hypothetical protein
MELLIKKFSLPFHHFILPRSKYSPKHPVLKYPQSVKMAVFWVEAAKTCEMLVNFYQTTRRYNPEDSHLRTHRRENLKSYP